MTILCENAQQTKDPIVSTTRQSQKQWEVINNTFFSFFLSHVQIQIRDFLHALVLDHFPF